MRYCIELFLLRCKTTLSTAYSVGSVVGDLLGWSATCGRGGITSAGALVGGGEGSGDTATRLMDTLLYTLSSRIVAVSAVEDCTRKGPVEGASSFVRGDSAISSAGD